MHKLGIIVPYRNRQEQLDTFIPYMKQYLEDTGIQNYTIIIVEQSRGKEFNRGSLLNLGFLEAEGLGCDYVIFHDLDMLPVDADYSYSSEIYQLAQRFKPALKIPYDYFGGVTVFPAEKFRKINGYSNEYWGWGFEDNDLLLRCKSARFSLGRKVWKQPETYGPALHFDGESYVEFSRPVSFRKSALFYTDFVAESLPVDMNKARDEESVFSVPGLDITLACDSFGTYKFELFDNYEDVYSIHTDKLPLMHCATIVYYDARKREFKFLCNGDFIGVKPMPKDRRIRVASDKMYLGMGDPNRTRNRKPFHGSILEFVAFDRCDEDVFLNLVEHGIDSFDFEDAAVWFSAKHVDGDKLRDLSGNERHGTLHNCSLTTLRQKGELVISVPRSKDGLYRLQKHVGNGAKNGHWKNWSSRVNQSRYENRVARGGYSESEMMEDGLNTVEKYFRTDTDLLESEVYLVKARSK